MKNIHNKSVGSDVERTDIRIDSTGEVFTPLELCNPVSYTHLTLPTR